MFRTLVDAFAQGLIILIVVLVVVFTGAIVLYIRRTWARGKAFLAQGLAQNLTASVPAVLSFQARSPTVHALWLEVEFSDLRPGDATPAYDIEAIVTANGVELARLVRRIVWNSGSRSFQGTDGLSLNCGFTCSSFTGTVRTLVFQPAPGSLVNVRCTFTPAPGLTCGPCRALITTTPKP